MTAPSTLICSTESLARHEALFATATRVDVWLALEYAPAWGFDAFPDSTLPDAPKAHLTAALKAIPRSRMQMIRQGGSKTRGRVSFFVAAAGRLYAFDLASYEDLLGLDIPAIAAGDARYETNRSDQRLFLLCVNGKRDQCCAKVGLAVYNAVGEQPDLWQTSHLGGHRFAATGVSLPEGLMYGRFGAASFGNVLAEYRAGQIALDHYRGCSYYDEPVQAAEFLLRRDLNERRIGALRLTGAESIGESRWRVKFAGDREHTLTIAQHMSPYNIRRSCTDEKASPVPEFQAVNGKDS